MNRWLTIREVCELTRWSAPTIYRKASLGEFPAPITRGRWSAEAVDAALRGAVNTASDWKVDANAIREAQAAAARRRKRTPAGRHI